MTVRSVSSWSSRLALTYARKVPTQRFFLEEMGLPVAVRPNLTDYSCRFDFGAFPLPLSADLTLQGSPCLSSCPQRSAAHSPARSCLGGCDSESESEAPSFAADISSPCWRPREEGREFLGGR